MPSTSKEIDIRTLVHDFAATLVSAVESATTRRIQAALLGAANGAPVRRGPGRPPKNAVFAVPAVRTQSRKRRVKQLCPVPGCKNPAAPVFGMVCSKHKDVPKAKIKEYREARRAQATGKSSKKTKAAR